MKAHTFWSLRPAAIVLSLAAAVSLPTAGLAGPVQATGAGACVVVLTCPDGRKLTAVPDAEGKFVVDGVPPGVCRLSVMPADVKDAASPTAAESRVLPTVNKVTDAEAPAARSDVTSPRDAATGMASGKRQHKPVVFRITLDDFPTAAKTMALDDWSKTTVSITVDATKKTRELTGHVTLIK